MSGSVRCLRPGHPVDLRRTLYVLGHGGLDPTLRLRDGHATLALRTPDGPALLDLRSVGAEIEATAWGAGAAWALEQAPAIAGCDDPAEDFAPGTRVAELWRRLPGVRVPRTSLVAGALLSVVLGQRVTTDDAARSYRAMVTAWGEPAPGPSDLWVPPDPALVAAQAYFAFHPLGIERSRAEVLRRIAASARRLDALAAPGIDHREAQRRMQALPGVGVWSSGSAAFFSLGDPDALPLGDLHLKHHVCWALAGERWGTDERMLELLEPFAGHRGRVCRLVVLSGLKPPARRPVRDPAFRPARR